MSPSVVLLGFLCFHLCVAAVVSLPPHRSAHAGNRLRNTMQRGNDFDYESVFRSSIPSKLAASAAQQLGPSRPFQSPVSITLTASREKSDDDESDSSARSRRQRASASPDSPSSIQNLKPPMLTHWDPLAHADLMTIPNMNGPVEVQFVQFIESFFEIDERQRSFTFNVLGVQRWEDPRLANSTLRHHHDQSTSFNWWGLIWDTRLYQPAATRQSLGQRKPFVRVLDWDIGLVEMTTDFVLEAQMSVASIDNHWVNMPFDIHSLDIDWIQNTFPADDVLFVSPTVYLWTFAMAAQEEWVLSPNRLDWSCEETPSEDYSSDSMCTSVYSAQEIVRIGSYRYYRIPITVGSFESLLQGTLEQSAESTDSEYASWLSISVLVERNPIRILRKLVLSVVSCIVVSAFAFFLPPKQLVARLALTFGCLLCTVLVNLANIQEASPGFLTRLDVFVTECIVLQIFGAALLVADHLLSISAAKTSSGGGLDSYSAMVTADEPSVSSNGSVRVCGVAANVMFLFLYVFAFTLIAVKFFFIPRAQNKFFR